jgi:hypothetical protein
MENSKKEVNLSKWPSFSDCNVFRHLWESYDSMGGRVPVGGIEGKRYTYRDIHGIMRHSIRYQPGFSR